MLKDGAQNEVPAEHIGSSACEGAGSASCGSVVFRPYDGVRFIFDKRDADDEERKTLRKAVPVTAFECVACSAIVDVFGKKIDLAAPGENVKTEG